MDVVQFACGTKCSDNSAFDIRPSSFANYLIAWSTISTGQEWVLIKGPQTEKTPETWTDAGTRSEALVFAAFGRGVFRLTLTVTGEMSIEPHPSTLFASCLHSH